MTAILLAYQHIGRRAPQENAEARFKGMGSYRAHLLLCTGYRCYGLMIVCVADLIILMCRKEKKQLQVRVTMVN